MWTREEEQRIVELAAGLWPQARKLTSDQVGIWSDSMGKFPINIVLAALRRCAKEREKPTRPQPCEVSKYCRALAREREAELGEQKEERCGWCLGNGFVGAIVWRESMDYVLSIGVPSTMYRTIKNQNECILLPEIARGVQAGEEITLQLACGHCLPRIGRMTCLEFGAKYAGFCEFPRPGDGTIFDRCRMPNPPTEPECITLEEYIAERWERMDTRQREVLQCLKKKPADGDSIFR